MQIQSSYIDHTLLDKNTLGNLYQNFDYFPIIQKEANDFVFVNTCHRVEFYYIGNNSLSFSINNVSSSSTQTTLETARRLINIMSGLNSIILGETFISQQVFTYINPSNKLSNFFVQCRDISNLARKKFNFYNNTDYNNIALSLLTNTENLVLIGGGMLVKDILNKVNHYKNITVITRNPKKFKKNFKQVDNITIIKLNNYVPKDNTSCIIATTLDQDYKLKIQNLINLSNFSKIVDLSSVPTYDLKDYKTNYLHMNDEEFLQKIEIGNSNFYNSLQKMKNFIDKHVYFFNNYPILNQI